MAALVVALVANAQVLINYEHTADLPAGVEISGTTVMKNVKIHENADGVDCIQFANGYTTDGALNGNCAVISTDGGFKAGDVVEIAGFFNNADDTKNSAFVIYVQDSSEKGYTVLWTSEKLINGRLVADEPRVDTYVLEQDAEKLYIARSGNTGTNIYTLKITRGGEAPNTGDFKATVTQYPTNDYSAAYAEYKLSELATALGTDAATLAAALADGSAVFGLFDAEGTLIETTADGPGSYWMGADGTVTNWGNGSVAYNSLIAYDADEDYFVIPIGQFPDAMQAGDAFAQTFTLKYDGKSVEIGVTLEVVARPVMEEPVTDLTQITIVKEYSATLDFVEGKSYEGRAVQFDAADLAEVLGADESALIANLQSVTLTQAVFVDSDADKLEYTDSLINARESTDGWFGRYTMYDEMTETETLIEQNALRTWGSSCTFYLQNPALEDGVFSITTGQFPGTLKAGDTDYAVLYVVNGSKAAKITYTVNVQEPAKVDFAEMTLAGEQTIDGSLEVASSYTSVAVTVDVDDILEKLGAESADDIEGWLLADEETLADPTNTDYWQGEAGFAQSWGDNACCQVKVDLANGTANLLQMPRYTEITEAQTYPMHYIFTCGDKYYKLTFNFTLTPIKQIEVEPYLVATEEFSMQIVPSPDTWVYGETYQLDVDYINAMIGTRNYAIYGDKWNEEESKLVWDKTYTCYDGDEKGAGFWYGDKTYETEDGQVVVDNAGWGQNSFGFQLSALGVITWFQYPGQRSVGESYAANLYLVNEETGAYIKYVVKVRYVEEITPETETVGEEEVTIMVSDELLNEDGCYVLPIDYTAMYEAMDIDNEIVAEAGVVVAKSLTMYAEGYIGDTFTLNEKGYAVPDDGDDAVISVMPVINDDDLFEIQIDDIMLCFDNPNTTIKFRIGFEYDGKRYIYTVNLTNDNTVVGINKTTASAGSKGIFTLSGMKVNSLQKGINIVKMADGSVKKMYVK